MAALRFSAVALCVAAFASCVLAQNNSTILTGEESLHTGGLSGNGSVVFLDDASSFAVCVYPASGTYSFLNRLLFYCTLVFSLFSRAHLWLVAGALAAALTYSGSAAVHACLLTWRGPNPYIENDSWVLFDILSSSCLIAVPLLNWSGTLRRLGAKAASIRDPHRNHTQSSAGTRTIVIYWAFLVLVGFLAIWAQVYTGADDTNQEYPVMSQVMCKPGTNGSMLLSADGTFHRRAIDSQFVQQNGCTDPCNQINIPSIFRQQSDLYLLTHEQALLWNGSFPGSKYEQKGSILNYENKLFDFDFNVLPFILVQGLIAVCFGRRDPREIRDLIYISLYMRRPLRPDNPAIHRTQDYLVRLLAACNYCLAVAVIILCPPLFLVEIIGAEFDFWEITPDAEAPYGVGQWEPWAIAVQVILAALIARYHDRFICSIGNAYRRFFPSRSQKAAQKIDNNTTSENADSDSRPLKTSAHKPDRPPPRPLIQRLRSTFLHFYKSLAHPLNQSDRGLLDEASNFFQWLQDPQAVSRLVVRDPIRPRDLHSGEGNEHDYKKSPDMKSLGTTEWQSPELGHGMELGEKERLDGGFFRGASVRRGGEGEGGQPGGGFGRMSEGGVEMHEEGAV